MTYSLVCHNCENPVCVWLVLYVLKLSLSKPLHYNLTIHLLVHMTVCLIQRTERIFCGHAHVFMTKELRSMTLSLFTSLAIIISSGALAQNPLCSQCSALQKKIPPQTESKSCLDSMTSQRQRTSKPVTWKATDLHARRHTSASASAINTTWQLRIKLL